jgi:hypothetical protein
MGRDEVNWTTFMDEVYVATCANPITERSARAAWIDLEPVAESADTAAATGFGRPADSPDLCENQSQPGSNFGNSQVFLWHLTTV